jgi:hypothetical protein
MHRLGVLGALLLLLGCSVPATAAHRTACGDGWTLVPTPRRAGALGFLGVSALSSSDVWAVGRRTAGSSRTLTERWDGSRWLVVRSPNPSELDGGLTAVSARGPSDAWAVGTYMKRADQSSSVSKVTTIRWDGTRWRNVPTPAPRFSSLTDVADVAGDDAWAVGRLGLKDIEHWDGRRWTRSAGASTRGSEHAVGVGVVSRTDVWVVGERYKYGGGFATFTEHWDGRTWTRVPAVDAGSYESLLSEVDGTAADDVWVVGEYRPEVRVHARTLIEHWNGTAWSVVPSPNVGTGENFLNAVVAAGPERAWAVGWWAAPDGHQRPLMLRWDGSAWSVEPPPRPGMAASLNDVDAAGGDVWAVGTRSDADGPSHPLALLRCRS